MRCPTFYRMMQIDGLSLFCREAGPKDAPAIVGSAPMTKLDLWRARGIYPGESTMNSARALGQEVESSPLSRVAQIGFDDDDDRYEGVGDSIAHLFACNPRV